jgi:hypothetical protein
MVNALPQVSVAVFGTKMVNFRNSARKDEKQLILNEPLYILTG